MPSFSSLSSTVIVSVEEVVGLLSRGVASEVDLDGVTSGDGDGDGTIEVMFTL